MITDQQLEHLIGQLYPNRNSGGFDQSEADKADAFAHGYRMAEHHGPNAVNNLFPKPVQPHPPFTTGASHMPPERVENGRQFQEEMIKSGLAKLTLFTSITGDSPAGVRVNIDCKETYRHMEHVIALVANTATQQRIRKEIETLKLIKTVNYEDIETSANVTEVIQDQEAYLLQCLSELEAQFADLSEKIFGTDKPLTDEKTPQAGTV